MGKNAEEKLADVIDQRDERIADLEREVKDLERSQEWTAHRDVDDDERLPVPRLEMRFEQDDGDWARFTVRYALVYRHLCDNLVAVPLGETRSRGSNTTPPMDFHTGKPALPFRDGAHIMHDSKHLGLPMFAVMDGKVYPLKDGDR